MNIDANTPERDVLIAYLENSGVSQQKEAAKAMREMQDENCQLGFKFYDADKAAKHSHQMAIQLSMLNEVLLVENGMLKNRAKPSFISRIVLWLKGK